MAFVRGELEAGCDTQSTCTGLRRMKYKIQIQNLLVSHFVNHPGCNVIQTAVNLIGD